MKSSRSTPQDTVGLSQPDAEISAVETCWNRFLHLLARPTNGASLAVFRICVGLVMALEAYSLTRPNPGAITAGGSPLETYYTGADITFNFPYPGFEWLP